MAQGRMLSKKISFDEKVAGLSLEATLLYTWCIPHLDCEGRIYAGAEILKGSVVPFIKPLTIQKIAKCVDELAQSGLVLHYGNGHKYLQFNGFENNQNIRKDREAPSVIPSPELIGSRSGVGQGQIKVNEIKVKESKATTTQPSDEDFIKDLKTNPVYKGINIDQEFEKMDRWLVANPQRQRTRKFILRWLSKADKTIEIKKETKFKPTDPNCTFCKGTGFVFNQAKSTNEICKCRIKT